MKFLGLLVVGLVSLVATAALAEGGADVATGAAALGDGAKQALAIGAGLGLALAVFGGALGQSKATAAAVSGIARNPESKKELFIPFMLGLVFMESLVLYMFVIAFFFMQKI